MTVSVANFNGLQNPGRYQRWFDSVEFPVKNLANWHIPQGFSGFATGFGKANLPPADQLLPKSVLTEGRSEPDGHLVLLT